MYQVRVLRKIGNCHWIRHWIVWVKSNKAGVENVSQDCKKDVRPRYHTRKYEWMLVLSYFHSVFSLLRMYASMQIACQTAAEDPVQMICSHHHKGILFHHVTDSYRGKNTWDTENMIRVCVDVSVRLTVIYRYASVFETIFRIHPLIWRHVYLNSEKWNNPALFLFSNTWLWVPSSLCEAVWFCAFKALKIRSVTLCSQSYFNSF